MERHPLLDRLSARIAGSAGEPVAHLIIEDVWLAVVDGSLESGERLPTARQLAIELNVSPRIIERAYAELERRGVVASRAGEGTFVSLTQPGEQERERHRRLTELCRTAVEQARELGFDVNELLEALADFRAPAPGTTTGEDRA